MGDQRSRVDARLRGNDEIELRVLLADASAKCGGDERAWQHLLRGLALPVRRQIAGDFFGWQAHGGQRPPALPSGDGPNVGEGWRVWLLMAGRGFGKTRAGSEWVQARVASRPEARVALVGATREEVERVMVRGPSGLLATAADDNDARWVQSAGRVDWANGARGFAYSAEAAEALRGPEHDWAWCDELAKWPASDAWSNLLLGMRRGANPQVVVTTTPKGGCALLKAIIAAPGTVVSGGRSADNWHLPGAFLAAAEALWGGTRLGRQELDGELIEEVRGALWPPALIERCRGAAMAPAAARRDCERIVVAVDPPAGEGTCGIVVAGASGETALVLEDASVTGQSPAGWARCVAGAFERWRADRVVAEANMGGQMVAAVLKGQDARLPVRLVHARSGKAARAEPVAGLFEAGKVYLCGRFAALEAELMRIVAGDAPLPSPDRADAMVWALTALMLEGRRGVPRMAWI